MTNNKWLFAIAFGVILTLCYYLVTKSNPQRKIEVLLHNHIEAMGGKSKWADLSSYRKIITRDNGLTLDVLCKMPDMVSLHFQKDDTDLYKKYNGEEGHILDGGRYQAMRPGEAVEMAEEAVYYSELMFALDNGYAMEYLGEEMVEGILCNKLAMIKSEGDRQLYWLDAESALIRQTGEYSEDSNHAGIFYKTILEDYRNVEGLMFPYRQSLIPNDGQAIVSETVSVEVNLEGLTKKDFTYMPDNTYDLIYYWKDQYADVHLRSFSFVQETIEFEDGRPRDTSTWYEAIEYPNNFRMDFGDSTEMNRNLYRNDSIYAMRKGEVVHKGKRIQEFMLLEGSTYHSPVDTTIKKLKDTGLDTDLFYESIYKGRPTYVIGAEPGDSLATQVWLDAEWRNSVMRVSRTRSGKLLKVTYDEFKEIDGEMIETWLEFYLDGELVQTERYNEIQINPDLDPKIFDPYHFRSSYWY